jgi:hypothetical protein
MSLWNAVLVGLIVSGTFNRPEFSLARHTALKLRAYFLAASLFERIGTTGPD